MRLRRTRRRVESGLVGKGGAWRFVDPASPLAPHFRALTENLLSSRGGVKSVVVTSPEPGAGCSSVCLGIGGAIVAMGRRAAVVDCNLEDPGLHRMLGEPNFIGLTSALDSGKPLEGYGREIAPGLLAVPTGPVPPDPVARRESVEFARAIHGLEIGYDLVLLDAPVAGTMLASSALCEDFGGVLLVVHASRTSKSAAREATDDLLEADTNLLGVVLNGAS